MDEQKPQKERRSILTSMVDPKTLPTLIPVMLAIGSAFVTLDRTIQRIDTEHEAVIADVAANTAEIDSIRDRVTICSPRVEALENDVEQIASDARDAKISTDGVRVAADVLKQSAMSNKDDIERLRSRVRDLERQVDKLEQ